MCYVEVSWVSVLTHCVLVRQLIDECAVARAIRASDEGNGHGFVPRHVLPDREAASNAVGVLGDKLLAFGHRSSVVLDGIDPALEYFKIHIA